MKIVCTFHENKMDIWYGRIQSLDIEFQLSLPSVKAQPNRNYTLHVLSTVTRWYNNTHITKVKKTTLRVNQISSIYTILPKTTKKIIKQHYQEHHLTWPPLDQNIYIYTVMQVAYIKIAGTFKMYRMDI
jgi:hypothetical protein